MSYVDLEEKVAGVQGEFRKMTARIRSAEQRMAELSVTRNHIIAYAKTCELYVAYRKAGYSKTFFEAHRADLTLHKAAKEHFTALGLKKLPTVKSLNQEYSQLLTRKKADYKAYTALKSQHHEVLTAKANLDAFLGLAQKKSRQKNAQER